MYVCVMNWIRCLNAGDVYSVSVRGVDVRRRYEWGGGSCDCADDQSDAVSVPGAADVQAASLQHRQAAGQLVAAGRRRSLQACRPTPGICHRTCSRHTNTARHPCRFLPSQTVVTCVRNKLPHSIRVPVLTFQCRQVNE